MSILLARVSLYVAAYNTLSVKYTIAAILIVASILLVWMYRTGTVQDILIMIVAIVSVTFFASIDSLWNYLYNRNDTQRAAMKDGGERVVVKLPDQHN